MLELINVSRFYLYSLLILSISDPLHLGGVDAAILRNNSPREYLGIGWRLEWQRKRVQS